MALSVVFNGVTYSIPTTGETGWSSLSTYLQALGLYAQTSTSQKASVRIATSSPVTVAANDFTVLTALAAPGAVAVTLPVGVLGQMYCIADGAADASSNNITVSGTGQNINGQATYVIKNSNGGALFQFNGTEWRVIGQVLGGLTANRAIQSNNSGEIIVSNVTSTELGYVSGVTSAIQTQLDAKQSTTLASANLLVGNGSNVATARAITGDIAIDNAGVTSIASGVIVNADVNASAAIAYSKLNLASSIVNADVNASAAIDYSKLATLTGDVTISGNVSAIGAGKVTSSMIADGTIVNADINASAAIAYSKLNLTSSVVAGDINSGAAANGTILTANGSGGAAFTAAATAISGTYTPTLTNTTNITSSTAKSCKYVRIGNIVTVTGAANIQPAGTGGIALGISLPIASTLTSDSLQGTGGNISDNNVGRCEEDTVNNRCTYGMVATTTTSRTNYFVFSYVVA